MPSGCPRFTAGGPGYTEHMNDRTPPDSTTGAHDDAQEIAEKTSKTVQPDDPMREPPNSTVDDWFGQRVQADADRLDEAIAEVDGSEGKTT